MVSTVIQCVVLSVSKRHKRCAHSFAEWQNKHFTNTLVWIDFWIYITLSIVFGSEFLSSLYSIFSKMWFRSTRKPVMLWNTVHYILVVFLPVCRLPSIVASSRVTWRTTAHLASKHNHLEFICAWHLCWQTSGFARQIIVILLHTAIHVLLNSTVGKWFFVIR